MIARRTDPGIPNIFTAEHQRHLREVERQRFTTLTAILTLLLSHEINRRVAEQCKLVCVPFEPAGFDKAQRTTTNNLTSVSPCLGGFITLDRPTMPTATASGPEAQRPTPAFFAGKFPIIEDRGRSETLFHQDDNHYQTSIDISYARDYLVDYDVRVLAVDGNMNRAEAGETIDGVLTGAIHAILDKLADMWNDFAEWAMEGLNWIVGYVIEKARALIQPVLDEVNSGFENFVNGLALKVKEGYENAGAIGLFVGTVGYIFTSALYYSLLGIVITLFVVEILVKCLLCGADSIGSSLLLPVLVPLIKGALIGIIAKGVSEIFDKSGNKIDGVLSGISPFASTAGVVSDGIAMYAAMQNVKSIGKWASSAWADLLSFVEGIIGLTLVKSVIHFKGVYHLIQDAIGLTITFLAAKYGFKEQLDKLSWVGKLGETLGYVSLAVSMATVLTTDYFNE